MPIPDYSRTCFVVMPFGKKHVGWHSRRWYRPWRTSRTVDFDMIYEAVFRPAIAQTPLPEAGGGYLVPLRADEEFVSGIITTEMFAHLEYSRFTLADITGLNFNVAYELGHRHRAHESGTAIFRQTDAAIPFDISHLRAFPYEYEPERQAEGSRQLITRVLRESLRENRLDSPVQTALRLQRAAPASLQEFLRDAENAIRHRDWAVAKVRLESAIELTPNNPFLRLRLGLVFKEQGDWTRALEQFDAALTETSAYPDVLREKGIAENKLQRPPESAEHAPGERSLRRALELRPNDFDALASLGGILKRAERYDDALAVYTRASDTSFGHPYPLINALILQASLAGAIAFDDTQRSALSRAERTSAAQAAARPPYNAPWSHFDWATALLLQGDTDGFAKAVEAALEWCTAAWQPMTFRRTLELLPPKPLAEPGVVEVLDALALFIDTLPQDQ